MAFDRRVACNAPSFPMPKVKSIEQMKKTRLCQEFVSSGTCKYGARCTFAHGEVELRPSVSVAGGAEVNVGGGMFCISRHPYCYLNVLSDPRMFSDPHRRISYDWFPVSSFTPWGKALCIYASLLSDLLIMAVALISPVVE